MDNKALMDVDIEIAAIRARKDGPANQHSHIDLAFLLQKREQIIKQIAARREEGPGSASSDNPSQGQG